MWKSINSNITPNKISVYLNNHMKILYKSPMTLKTAKMTKNSQIKKSLINPTNNILTNLNSKKK